MSTTRPNYALEQRGTLRELGEAVVGVAFSGAVCGFCLADGSLRLVPLARRDDDWHQVSAHDGGALCFAGTGEGFVSGGDDGRLCRIAADGQVTEIARYGSKWVEQVAAHPGERGRALIAASVGKAVHLFDAQGVLLKTVEHPSTVAALAFDARGKRFAAAHYNGVSLWFVAAKVDTPRRLEWKGSHIGLALSPDGDAVVTAMQENALHGWRLSDEQHMRMSGYPSKTRALSFSRNGKWLATSGADSVVLWPFFGGGPMGKAPTELGGADGVLCTSVAAHPQHESVAAGFSDGLVLLADIATQRILPVAPPGHGEVSAMAWSSDGSQLAFGTETGFAALVDFARRD
jgi:WD40 repeat protein